MNNSLKKTNAYQIYNEKIADFIVQQKDLRSKYDNKIEKGKKFTLNLLFNMLVFLIVVFILPSTSLIMSFFQFIVLVIFFILFNICEDWSAAKRYLSHITIKRKSNLYDTIKKMIKKSNNTKMNQVKIKTYLCKKEDKTIDVKTNISILNEMLESILTRQNIDYDYLEFLLLTKKQQNMFLDFIVKIQLEIIENEKNIEEYLKMFNQYKEVNLLDTENGLNHQDPTSVLDLLIHIKKSHNLNYDQQSIEETVKLLNQFVSNFTESLKMNVIMNEDKELMIKSFQLEADIIIQAYEEFRAIQNTLQLNLDNDLLLKYKNVVNRIKNIKNSL